MIAVITITTAFLHFFVKFIFNSSFDIALKFLIYK